VSAVARGLTANALYARTIHLDAVKIPHTRETSWKGDTRGKTQGRSTPEFVDALTSGVMGAVSESPSLDLTRLSLTLPKGHGSIGPAAESFVRQCAERDTHGALLSLDLRPESLDEHLFGIAVHEGEDLAGRWCRLTGAKSSACLAHPVRGLRQYREAGVPKPGFGSLLEDNLRRVLGYAFHPLPGGIARDLANDVWASGALAGPWTAARTPSRIDVAPGGSGASTGRPGGAQSLHDPLAPTCERCGKGLEPGRRRDARHCGVACRVAMHKRRRRQR